MPDTNELESLSHLAYTLRSSVPTIRRVAKQLGIEAAVRINGVPHYSAEQCSKVEAAIKMQGH